ncbi:DUF2608 domain-containing protein [Spongorhabdus nitratireducens]
MRLKACRTLLAVIFLFVSCNLFAQPETSRPGEYLEAWFSQSSDLKGTLVLLDLDETVLTTPVGQWLGHSLMFYYLRDELQAQDTSLSRQQAAATVDVLLEVVYPRVPLALTDSRLPKVISQLRHKGAEVIGMTSRGLGIKDITLWQLQQAGIQFTDTGEPRWVPLDQERQIRLEGGVIFVSHGNKKGESLNKLLIEGKQPFAAIKRVVMVDDKQRHLDDITASLKELKEGLQPEFQAILCTFPRVHGDYRPHEGSRQLMHFLNRWRADVVVSQLMLNDHYTRGLMRAYQPEPDRKCPCLPEG